MVAQTGHRVEKTVTHPLYSTELGLLWVKSRHPTTPCRTSAIGGKADIGRCLTRNHDLNVRYWG